MTHDFGRDHSVPEEKLIREEPLQPEPRRFDTRNTPHPDDMVCFGMVSTTEKVQPEAIVVLSEERGILVQIMLVYTNPTQSKQAIRAFLDAIVYGPYGLFEDVGDFTQECNLYLQDPVGCICNLPYINPHRLPKAEQLPMTYDLPRSYYRSNASAPRDVSEFFANFESEETPDTVNTPAALRTQLHP
ncbi:alpha-1,6-mannosyltransferase [Botryosphaeria dothidea]